MSNATKERVFNLVKTGDLTMEDLIDAEELLKNARLVNSGVSAAKNSILFRIGETSKEVYHFQVDGIYHKVNCDNTGKLEFVVEVEDEGDRLLGTADLMDPMTLLKGLSDEELSEDIRMFLKNQTESFLYHAHPIILDV